MGSIGGLILEWCTHHHLFWILLPQYVSFSFGDLVSQRHYFLRFCFRCVTYTYFNVLCISEQVFHLLNYSRFTIFESESEKNWLQGISASFRSSL